MFGEPTGVKVLLPLMGVDGFALVAIATPGSEHNHYSQMMNLKDKNGEPLMMTIRTSLVCPACLDKGLNEACEHRLDLLPPWKSSVGMNKVRQILDSDQFLNQRENLGVITDAAHYFIKPDWVNAMRDPQHIVVDTANPRLVFIGIDPSGGGSASSWAMTAVYFQNGDCVVRARAVYSLLAAAATTTPALKSAMYAWRNSFDNST